MSANLDQLKLQADSLSIPERAELAHYLLISLEPEEEGVEAAWQAELDRRMGEVLRGEVKGIPLDALLAEFRERKT